MDSQKPQPLDGDPELRPLDQGVLSLGRLLADFSVVTRDSWLDRYTRESDTDHTVMLAVLACAVAKEHLPALDIGKVAQYALAHDLLEAYTGDYPLSPDSSPEEKQKMKEERKKKEHEARAKIKDEFPLFPWLHETIESYERLDEREARFVKALDKALAAVLHNLNDGIYYERPCLLDPDELRRRVDERTKELHGQGWALDEQGHERAEAVVALEIRERLMSQVIKRQREKFSQRTAPYVTPSAGLSRGEGSAGCNRPPASARLDCAVRQQEESQMSIASRVRSGGNVEIAYDITGGGPTILLLHGIAEDRTAWDSIGRLLTPRYTVVRVDLRGHGESSHEESLGYGLDDLVLDVRAVLRELNAHQISVVGHSLGGLIATALPFHLKTFGDQVEVAAVVNVDQKLDLASFSQFYEQHRSGLQGPDFSKELARTLCPLLGSSCPDVLSESLHAGWSSARQHVILGIWDDLTRRNIDAVLGAVQMPYLSLHRGLPNEAYKSWLKERIDHAQIAGWPYCVSHWFHRIHPETFVKHVEEFLAAETVA